MIFSETKLKGAFLIDLEKRFDSRGFFVRVFCEREYAAHGLDAHVAQANASFNRKKGTLRGMHRQTEPFQEAKTVCCTRGAIYDVIIDLRPASATYKQWVGVELDEDDHRMLYVPRDFAHGFLTLRDQSEVTYLVSQAYEPDYETGLRWDDPMFGIEWPKDVALAEISDRDRTWPDYVEKCGRA